MSSDSRDPRENPAFVVRRTRAITIREEEKRETIFLVTAEVLFVLLPFFIIGLLFYFKGKFHELGTQPEWALAASVISGQAIVKCISGFLSMPKGRSAWQKVSLWITVAIFFSLTPSLLILTLVFTGEGAHTPTALVRAQIAVFFMGL